MTRDRHPSVSPRGACLRMGWASRLIRSVSRSWVGSLTKCLPSAVPAGLRTKSLPLGASPRCGSKEERARAVRSRSALRGPQHETMEERMTVIIGVDPHKASHTAVAIDTDESELATIKVRSTRRQVPQLLAWAEPLGQRTWAIESAAGLGYLLSQQLVDAGEHVIDVPATLASRVRLLASSRSNKNDPNDALSVAVAALRSPGLRPVRAADHAEVLGLLAKRNIDIGNHRTRVVCRLHAVLAALAPGGIAKELNASDAVALLDAVEPVTPVEQGSPRPGRRAPRRRPAARRTAEGVAPAYTRRQSRRRTRRSPTCSEWGRSSPAT